MAEQRNYRLGVVVELQDRMRDTAAKVQGTMAKMESQYKRLRQSAAAFGKQKIAPVLNLRDQQFLARIKAAGVAVSRLTSKAWSVTLRVNDKVTQGLDKAWSKIRAPVLIGAAATTMLLGVSANKAITFEAQMSTIKALTGASSEEMSMLTDLSLKMGAKTKYSALEAAQGMEELLKAGLSPAQVKAGALEDALNLATAGSLGLADAAEIMSTALNAFRDDAMTSAQVANILAGTANASATSVQELRYSLAMVSAVASGIGLSFEDTNLALGTFANNGLKGSDAGTSLKTMLMNLIPTTKQQIEAFSRLGILTADGANRFFTAEGKVKSMAEIAGVLQKSLAGMSSEQRMATLETMFGADAIRAANILYKEGATGVRKFHSEMAKVTALEVAREKMNNAAGAIERLKGAFETVQIIALTPWDSVWTKLADYASSAIEKATPGITATMTALANRVNNVLDVIFTEDKYMSMDWDQKIIYVLDRAMDALDSWASGEGAQKFGRVMTKLFEVGMKAWTTALGGMLKSSVNAAMEGNLAGAAGLAIGAHMLGGGAILGGLGKVTGWAGRAMGRGAGAAGAAGAATTAAPGAASGALGNLRAGYSIMREGGAGRMKSLWEGAKLAAEGTKIGSGMSRLGAVGGVLQKIAMPVTAVIDAFTIANMDQKKTGETVGGVVGHWAGMVGGAKLGAALGATVGSIVPGVGTAIGGALGSAIMGAVGFFVGDKIGAMAGKWIDQIKSKTKPPETANPADYYMSMWGVAAPQPAATPNMRSLKELLPGHAAGGIFWREHIARFAEGNRPEAVVPLRGNRQQSLGIWQQAGAALGVSPLAVAGAGGSPAVNVNIYLQDNQSDEEIADAILAQIMKALQQIRENRG